MNCKKAEELIMLYSELSQDEQSKVAVHLDDCASCSILFESNQMQHQVIMQAQNWNPEIKNPIAFTDEIMKALPSRSIKSQKSKNSLSTLFNWSPLQTGLATCSLVLAFTFTMEFNSITVANQHQSIVKNGVTFSSDHEKLIQAKRLRTARFSLDKIIIQENYYTYQND